MSIVGKIIERVRLRLLLRQEYEGEAIRRWFKDAFEVDVGMYSYGCFDRWRVPPRTRIGRYCSFARSVRILDANHPIQALTTHPYLYDPARGVVTVNPIDPEWLIVEDDVWMSHNATITPGCKFVGRGSIIAAGAVVTKDVPRYAVVAGAPAKIIRYRFDEETQAAIEASRWWELDKDQLRELVQRVPELTSNAGAIRGVTPRA
ncbi:MAG: CatB-related O-acetyltransferase [Phenylobacterium sp.]|nr:CatB-related O-acetyltransferase [Phenylobacterium sp.]